MRVLQAAAGHACADQRAAGAGREPRDAAADGVQQVSVDAVAAAAAAAAADCDGDGDDNSDNGTSWSSCQ